MFETEIEKLMMGPAREIVLPTAVPDPPSDFNYHHSGIFSDGINARVRTGVRNCSGINNLARRNRHRLLLLVLLHALFFTYSECDTINLIQLMYFLNYSLFLPTNSTMTLLRDLKCKH